MGVPVDARRAYCTYGGDADLAKLRPEEVLAVAGAHEPGGHGRTGS